MKNTKLLIILMLGFAISCTPDYDDVEPALYDVLITKATETLIISKQTGHVYKRESDFTILVDHKNATQSEKNDYVQSFPEKRESTLNPLNDGSGRYREIIIIVRHEITRK